MVDVEKRNHVIQERKVRCAINVLVRGKVLNMNAVKVLYEGILVTILF